MTVKAETLAALSPLARQFLRFCRHLDPEAGETALLSAALVAERNRDGHTCIDLATLAGRPQLPDAEGRPLFRPPALEAWHEALASCAFVATPEPAPEQPSPRPLVLEGHRLYPWRHWRDERTIARALLQRCQPVIYDSDHLKARLAALFPEREGPGAAGQKRAAATALTGRLAIVTGGPGTGKTTTVTRILALLLEQEPELRILLAAPTGKAAARLGESIGHQVERLAGRVEEAVLERIPRQAATLHRLLGWRPEGFAHHGDNPLPCDCLLIDETSMVDQALMAAVVAALPPHARLILLGDRHQLSSVEAGSVLGDLTGHGAGGALSPGRAREIAALTGSRPAAAEQLPAVADHIAELTHSYRFDGGGGIGRLAAAVRDGERDEVERLLDRDDPEIDRIEAGGDEPAAAIVTRVLELYRPIFDATSPEEALARFDRARLLTARAEGPWGAAGMTERIERALRRERLITVPPGRPYRGQPLLILENDAETGLFNGDTGILWPGPGDRLMAWFPNGETTRPFDLAQLPRAQSAWSLTIHRSQGSEYERVVLLLPPHESRIVTRELIYTGITRARRHCTLVASRPHLLEAIGRTHSRHSGLAGRLGW